MNASRLLTEAEMQAERIVAFVRLGIPVIGGGIFYVAIIRSPLASESRLSAELPFIVAYFAGYFAIGLVSLVLADPRRFRAWMPWAFTTCDLGFWFALLATSVDNLGLPASQIVLAPPILLAPTVLALAALRYNTWLQVYATALVVAALVAASLLAPTSPADAVSGANGLDLLFQTRTNIIRLSMLALAAGALIVTVSRARALLHRAAAETVRRVNLTRYLPAQLADRMAATGEDATRVGRLQDAAVLFVDIRDFTARAEGMEPEALSRFLAGFRHVVTRAAEGCGGVVDKFVGDSAMVVFGVPEPGPRDAANALNGARAILAAVDSWNDARKAAGDDAARIGIGVHCGRVFCGAIGDESRLEFTVLGDTVNVAARLQELTKRTGYPLVVSDTLLRSADIDPRLESDWVALPDTTVRGRLGDVRLYGSA